MLRTKKSKHIFFGLGAAAPIFCSLIFQKTIKIGTIHGDILPHQPSLIYIKSLRYFINISLFRFILTREISANRRFSYSSYRNQFRLLYSFTLHRFSHAISNRCHIIASLGLIINESSENATIIFLKYTQCSERRK